MEIIFVKLETCGTVIDSGALKRKSLLFFFFYFFIAVLRHIHLYCGDDEDATIYTMRRYFMHIA